MKRQAQIVAAMLSNFESAENAMESMKNATGSAETEMARAAEGINFKLNQVANNMQKFWSSSINADGIRSFADVLVSITSNMADMAESLDMGKVALTGLIGVMLLANGTTKGLIMSFATLGTVSSVSQKAFLSGSASLFSWNSGALIATGSTNMLSASVIGLKIATVAATAAITFGLSFAITSLATALYTAINAKKEARKEMDMLGASYADFARSNERAKGQIETLGKEYEELTKKTNLTADEQKKFNDLSNEIATLAPGIVERYTKEGNAVINLKNGYQDLIKEMERANELRLLEIAGKSENYYDALAEDIRLANLEMEKINKSQEILMSGGTVRDDSGNVTRVYNVDGIEQIEDKIKSINKQIEESTNPKQITTLRNLIPPLEAEIESLNEQQTQNALRLREINAEIETLTNQYKPYISAIIETDDAFKDLDDSSKNIIATIATMPEFFDGKNFRQQMAELRLIASSMADGEISGFIDQIEKLNDNFDVEDVEKYRKEIDRLIGLIAELAGIDPDILRKMFDISTDTDGLEETIVQTKSLEEAQKEVIKAYEETLESYKDIDDALGQYNENQRIDESSKLSLIKTYPQLLSLIDDEKGFYEELGRIRNQVSDDSIVNLENQLAAVKQTIVAKGDQYGIDLQNFTTAQEAKLLIAEAVEKRIRQINSMQTNVGAGQDAGARAAASFERKIEEEIGSQVDIWSTYNDAISRIVSGIGGLDNVSRGAKSTTEAYAALYDQYMKLNNAIDKNNNALEENRAELSLASGADQIPLLQRQNELFEERKRLFEELANAYRKERSELEAYLSSEGFTFSGDGDRRVIDNLENIEGKTKDVEEAFKRYLDLGISQIPNLTKEMLGLRNSIADTTRELDKLRLENLFEPTQKGLEDLAYQAELLDFKLQMVDTDDFQGRVNAMSGVLGNAQTRVAFLREELKRLHAEGFQAGIETMDEYNSRIRDLENQYRQAQLEVKRINDQMRQEYERELADAKSQREKIADDIVRVIQEAYRKQEKIVVESLKKQIEAEEKAHKARIDRLDEQLAKYDEIIQAQIGAIDKQQDEEQWEKDLSEAQEERANLLRDINIYSMDDSMEARNKVFELEKSLAEQEEKIAEMKKNREVNLRKENLRDQQQSYRKEIEEKKQAEEDKFTETKNRIDQEIEMEQRKFDALINDERRYAQLRQDIMNGNVAEAQSLIEGFLSDFQNMNQSVVEGIGASWQSVLNLIHRAQEAQAGLRNMPSDPSKPNYNPEPNTPPPRGGGGGTTPQPDAGEQPSDNTGPNYYALGRPMDRGDGSYIAFAMSPNGRTKQLTLKDGRIVERHLLEVGDVIRTLDDFWKWDGSQGVRFTPPRYAKGGEISTTGLKWMDGSSSAPERVLSAEQTQSFNKLVGYLPNMINKLSPSNGKIASGGADQGLNIGSLIHVEGNVDKNVMDRLENVSKNVLNDLKKELNKGGTFRPIRTF